MDATLPLPPARDATALAAYADLLLRVGVNLQPGQGLVVRAQIEAAPLVRPLAEAAYRLGAPLVEVMWGDDAVTRARFLHAADGTFETVPAWRADGMRRMAEAGYAELSILSDDPDLLAGADPARWSTYVRAWQRVNRAHQAIVMADGVPWCVAGYPGVAWARKAFPGLEPADAVARLWAAIRTAVRLDRGDPVAAWRRHAQELRARREALQALDLAALRFRGPDTDLEVGLAEGHVWLGGSSVTAEGVPFVPNMPTEEVFTAPHRDRVNGVVRASLPLVNGGTVIEGIALRFRQGRVVEASASRGEAALRRILDTDEGALRLGEVALVSAASPIRRAGVLFWETLFDENAASHVALGKAYPTTVRGAAAMSAQEAAAAGLNDSLTHVDFMIGSEAMDVDGVRASGAVVPVMRAGAWVD